MTDIAISWNNNAGMGDWQLANGDVVAGDDLTSAVLVSLFTDKYASSDYRLPSPASSKRGWWGSTYESREIGSSLWQLDRAKFSDQTDLLLRARDYTKQALQWMIDIGLAKSISVVTSRQGANGLGIAIVITKPVTDARVTFEFSAYWNNALGK